MKSELQLQGVRLTAGLASSDDLRGVADKALNAGIYSPSLAETALFSEHNLAELAPDYTKALHELQIDCPTDEEEIIWYLLRYYIGEVAGGRLKPSEGVETLLKEVYYHFNLYERSVNYVGDSHNIERILGDYYAFDDVGPERYAEIEESILSECRKWLHQNSQPSAAADNAEECAAIAAVMRLDDKHTEKAKGQLRLAENRLRSLLLRVLPRAVESGADYFTNSAFNPHGMRSSHMQPDAETLLQLAEESLALRDQLYLPKQGSVGELYLMACSEAADLSNERRRGPRKLAVWLSQELEAVITG